MSPDPIIAMHRFGFGAGPDDADAAHADPHGWLHAQLAAPITKAPLLASLPDSRRGLREFPRMSRRLFEEGRIAQPLSLDDSGGAVVRQVEAQFREACLPALALEASARLTLAATTRLPFRERLIWFWANHFTVSAAKPQVWNIAGAFEREAIRPNVAGRFLDLLRASVQHPAMVIYLDNRVSVKPQSSVDGMGVAGSFPPPSGFNENLAREVLELHTLGVEAGYTQSDVRALALALTGWTVSDHGGFRFDAEQHDETPQTLLGRVYDQPGVLQGEAMLADLAVHPSTARHVARRLARHVYADDPKATSIERIAAAFRATAGDLTAVHAALVDAPEPWSEPWQKLKSPCEFVGCCLRTLRGRLGFKPEELFLALEDMGQATFFPPSPEGWPDIAAAWTGSDALWKRIEFAQLVGSRAAPGPGAAELARRSFGAALDEATAAAIDRSKRPESALALLFASPEFQRR